LNVWLLIKKKNCGTHAMWAAGAWQPLILFSSPRSSLSLPLSPAALSFWLSNPRDWIDPLGQVTFCSFCSFCDCYFFLEEATAKAEVVVFCWGCQYGY